MIKVHVLQIQIDIRLIRLMLAFFHLTVAAIAFWRHNMVDIIPAYASFALVGNTTSWGLVAMVIGVGLLRLNRGTLFLVVCQFASATYFANFAYLLSKTNGLTWGTAAYLFPAILSYIVMWNTLHEYFDKNKVMVSARDKIQGRRHA